MFYSQVYFRDHNAHIVETAKRYFENVDCDVGSPTDLMIDSVVSPANSFGFMNGGIDYHYLDFFGNDIQIALWDKIQQCQFKELLVGDARHVRTGHARIPYLIAAPTMRTPQRLPDALNVYLAARAAMRYAIDSEWDVCFSGMGTGVGGLEIEDAIRAMGRGIKDAFLENDQTHTSIRDACLDQDEILGKQRLQGAISKIPRPNF